MRHLVVTTPNARSFHYEMAGGIVRIGRAGRNEVAVEDPTVSRVHAEIVRRQEGYFLIDLGGKSGTFVNGRRITTPTLLHPGDQIRLGTTLMILEGDPTTPVEITQTPMPAGPGTRILTREEVRQSEVLTPTPMPQPGELAVEPLSPVPSRGRQVSALAASKMMRAASEVDRELVFHRSVEEILEKIMDLALEAVGYERGVLMLMEGSEMVTPVVRLPRGEESGTIRICRAIVDRVVGRQESVLTSDALSDERFLNRDSVIGQNIRSAMCVPLLNGDRVIGLLYVDSRREPGLFTEDDLRVLAHLASVTAVKIENARLFGRAVRSEALELELRQAAAIQESLLPVRGPAIPGYRVGGKSIPCRSVGGDCFDYIELPEGRYAFGLGDVAGKGLAASLLMCWFNSSLRALAGLGLAEGQLVTRLNRLLCPKFPTNRFVALFYGVLDPLAHRMNYVNAGLEPPFLLRRGGEVKQLPLLGMPLGLFEETEYTAGSVSFDPGDVLLCYSDGVTEGRNPMDEMFGADRLITAGRNAGDASPEEILSAITREIAKHHAGSPYEDDITLLVVQRNS
jgi:serine phosphatase RsbU (regulator of sigma subunit)